MSDISVSEDPDLGQDEKECTIRVSKRTQRLTVHSEIASITRALLKRSDFKESTRRTVEGDVVSVTGELPMGVLKVQKNERAHGAFSTIVSETDE